MSEVNRYVVVAENSIAKFGRYLNVGEVIELEERQAHTDFAGRVAPESDPKKPTARWEESSTALTSFERDLKQTSMRAHERVQLLEVRKKALSQQLTEVDSMLAQANTQLVEDEKKIKERHAAIAARAVPQPVPAPTSAPAQAPTTTEPEVRNQ